jgi:hypothetical protein
MSTNNNNTGGNQKSNGRLHGFELGETRDFKNLSYDEEKNSFEYDVKGNDKEYDHPLPYDTAAANGGDENSDYDEANPYIGDEYAKPVDKAEQGLVDMGMHVDNGSIVEVEPEDEFLARTPEDDRPDLDEEGYPINDAPPKK